MYSDTILLLAEPGDLILWDSRTVHGGRVGTGSRTFGDGYSSGSDNGFVSSDAKDCASDDATTTAATTTTMPPLVRLSCTVAMTPRSKATGAVLQLRKNGFDAGVSFNHCPHEAGTSTGTIRSKLPAECPRPILTDWQRSLL